MGRHAQKSNDHPRTRRGRAPLALVSVGALAVGLVAALAPAAGADAPSTTNLVVNGDFATPALTGSYSGMGTGSSIGAWTVDAGSVDLVSHNYWSAPAGDPATTQSVDLSGTAPGSISQTIALVPGAYYEGSYELAGNPDSGPANKTITLKIGHTTFGTSFNTTGHSRSDMGWVKNSFGFSNVFGAVTSAQMTFTSTTAGSAGPVITDVSLHAVPPPVITSVPDIHVLQTTSAGTAVDYTTPTATDPNDGDASLPVTCSQDSGTVFPVGATTVTCKARAATAPFLSASTSFTVTVSPVAGDCRARALAFDGPRPGLFGVANGPETPCGADSITTASASVVIVPGIPLLRIPATGISAGVLQGATTTSTTATSSTVTARADVANVSIYLLGVSIQLTALHSAAASTVNGSCAGSTSGSSSVGTLVVNGKSYVIGDKPFHLDLGLVKLDLNQHVVVGNQVVQRAFFLSGNNDIYDTAIAESIAGVSCA